MLPHFLVTQALFFLGAAWFRKVQFVKTVGSAVAIVLVSLARPSRSPGWSAAGGATRRFAWTVCPGRSSGSSTQPRFSTSMRCRCIAGS